VRTGIRCTRLLIALCDVMVVLIGPSAHGAEWSVEPSVRLRAEYNDNINLTPQQRDAVFGAILSPDVKFNWQTETTKVTGGLSFNVNRYDEHSLDTVDHALLLLGSYTTELDTFGLRVDSIRDSTLTSELASTGVVLKRTQRNYFAASPTWTRRLTERTDISATYGYTSARYQDTVDTGLVDYQDQGVTVAVRTRYSEIDSLTAAGYADNYRTEGDSVRGTTYGGYVGWDRRLSETFQGTLRVGLRTTNSKIAADTLVCDGVVVASTCMGTITQVTSTTKETSSGYTLLASVRKQWATTILDASISREINPSGSGSLVQTDRIGFGVAYQWTPTIDAYLNAGAYNSRYIGGVFTDNDSRYYTVEPRVAWRITEQWVLDVGYRYVWQRTEGAASARANVAYATISYTWPKIATAGP